MTVSRVLYKVTTSKSLYVTMIKFVIKTEGVRFRRNYRIPLLLIRQSKVHGNTSSPLLMDSGSNLY